MGKANAYSIFVSEEFRRRQRSGEKINIGQMYKICDPLWRKLSEDVKQNYRDKAKNVGPPAQKEELKRNNSAQNSGNSQPDSYIKIDMEEVERAERKPPIKLEEQQRGVKRETELQIYETEEEERKRIKLGHGVPNFKNIRNSSNPDVERYSDYNLLKLRNTCESIVNTKGDRIILLPMYSYSVNVLCKHRSGDKDKYIPIEIGIFAYSIETGAIGKPYHVLIDPGPVPTGFYNASRDHAVNHKITFNSSGGGYPPQARKDYAKIYKEMLKYTKGGERTILIADERDLAQALGSIEWLFEKATQIDKTITAKPTTWTILPLVEYVASAFNFVFQRMLHKGRSFFTIHYFMKLQLETSCWDYDDTLMCSYHAKPDTSTKWCAQNCSIRAIKCLEAQLENIYRMHKQATQTPQQTPIPQPCSSTQPTNRANFSPILPANINLATPPNAAHYQMPRLSGPIHFNNVPPTAHFNPIPSENSNNLAQSSNNGTMPQPQSSMGTPSSSQSEPILSGQTILGSSNSDTGQPVLAIEASTVTNRLDPRLKNCLDKNLSSKTTNEVVQSKVSSNENDTSANKE